MMVFYHGIPITIYEIAELVNYALQQAFNALNIPSGFKVAGIYPLNHDIFESHEYLSLYVTD